MKKISLLIIDDNRLVCEGLKAVIKQSDNMTIAAEYRPYEFILKKIAALNLNMILINLDLKNQSSLKAVLTIHKAFPSINIVGMNLPEHPDILEFIHAGISGFILRDATVDDLLKTLRKVVDGEKVLPQNLTPMLFKQIIKEEKKVSGNIEQLTKRETQIIEMIQEGLTNKEIAQKLFLSISTIKSHVHNILEKLSLNTRQQIAKYCSRNQLLDITDKY
ncbi:MAG: response regulator transcription factor [Ignavibacteriaceae bacterium]